MLSSKKTKKIKRDRYVRKITHSEIIATVLAGIIILIFASPLVIFYIVSSKEALSIEAVQNDSIDEVVIVIEDSHGNEIDENDLEEILERNNFSIEPQEVSLNDKEIEIISFCEDLFVENVTIVVIAFDYLLPYIAYDCANNDIVTYGIEVESEQNIAPGLLQRIEWAFRTFF